MHFSNQKQNGAAPSDTTFPVAFAVLTEAFREWINDRPSKLPTSGKDVIVAENEREDAPPVLFSGTESTITVRLGPGFFELSEAECERACSLAFECWGISQTCKFELLPSGDVALHEGTRSYLARDIRDLLHDVISCSLNLESDCPSDRWTIDDRGWIVRVK